MNVQDVVARLKAHQEALGSPGDVRSDNERAHWWATTREVARLITILMNPDTEKPTRLLADLEARRAAVVEKQEQVEQEIAAAPDALTIADGRERDREHDRQRHVRRQLEMLHDGTLLCAPGVAYARLRDLDQQIADQRRRLDRAQMARDAALRQAEALLTATAAKG